MSCRPLFLRIVVTISMVLAACTTSDSTSDSTDGSADEKRELVIRTHSELSSLAWYIYHGGEDYPMAIANTGLVAMDINGDPLPRLAKSWEISDDLKTYTFHLNEWVWSDGEPVTSEDVKFSIEEVLRPHHAFGQSAFAAVDRIETPDPQTVVIKLNAARGPDILMRNFTDDIGPIVPKHAFEGCEDILKCPVNDNPITAGPYMFEEWVKGSHVTLVQNPHWVGEEPDFERITWRIIREADSAVLALRRGEVDIIPQFPAIPCRDVLAFKEDPNFQVIEIPSLTGDTPALLMNGYTPPLNSTLVRQAIATAIDRQAIIDSIYCGLAEPVVGHTSDQGPFEKYSPEATGEPPSGSWLSEYDYDPDKAAEMLDRAGHPVGSDGTRFTLKFTTITNPPLPEVADAIAGFLEDVDIKVVVDPVDEPTHWGRIYGPDPKNPWQGYNLGFVTAGWVHPEHLRNWYHSSRLWDRDPDILFGNAWNFESSEFDTAIDTALSSSGQEHIDAIVEVQRILAEELPQIPIATLTLTAIANKCVQGLPLGYGLFMLSPYPQGDTGQPYDLGWKPNCET